MEEKVINQSPTNEEVKRIGRLLKSIRIAAGLTQQEVVGMADGTLKINTLIAIEAGKYNAGIKQVSTYANLLGYEVVFIRKAPTPGAHPHDYQEFRSVAN